jgi:MFS family permease
MDANSKPVTKYTISNYKVVLGVIIIKIFNRSVTSVFGLLFEAFFWRLKSSQVEISSVMNATYVISNIAGIFSGFVTKFVSTRNIAIFGTLCVSFGLILTSFVSSFAAVIMTYSLLVGGGVGLVSISTFLAITDCFTEKRVQAVAISSAGGVVGDIVMPQLVGFFLVHVRCETTILLTGVVALLGTIGSFLLAKRKEENVIASEETPLITEQKSRNLLESMDLDLLTEKDFLIRIFGLSLSFVVCADFDLIFPFFLKV